MILKRGGVQLVSNPLEPLFSENAFMGFSGLPYILPLRTGKDCNLHTGDQRLVLTERYEKPSERGIMDYIVI